MTKLCWFLSGCCVWVVIASFGLIIFGKLAKINQDYEEWREEYYSKLKAEEKGRWE